MVVVRCISFTEYKENPISGQSRRFVPSAPGQKTTAPVLPGRSNCDQDGLSLSRVKLDKGPQWPMVMELFMQSLHLFGWLMILIIYQLKYFFCAYLEQIAHLIYISNRKLFWIMHHHRKTIHFLPHVEGDYRLLYVFEHIVKGQYPPLRNHGLDKVITRISIPHNQRKSFFELLNTSSTTYFSNRH